MKDFSELDLPEALRHTLAHMEFSVPTPIQAQAIPAALEGQDILGTAQTGTGKTGAFGIPLVAKLINNSRGSALVMTPTRELAVQVLEQLKKMLGKQSSIKSALLIGGESMPNQLQQLRNRPRLLVGTPGRINDHLERGSLMLHDTNFLVLDETDRMLDMGFQVQIEKVLKFLPKQRQTLLFSATTPANIVKMSKNYLTNPLVVTVDPEKTSAPNIDHEVRHIEQDEKYANFTSELNSRTGSVIVFVKTKHGADKMALKLRKEGHSADAIHGDLRQNKRDRVIANFRKQSYRILIATDIAARGLDIPHIEHVINYDLPQCPEDFVHRIGRTARAGAAGAALSYVTKSEKLKWRAIERILDPEQAKLNEMADKGERSGKPRRGAGGKPGGKPSGARSGNRSRRDGASAGGSEKKGEYRAGKPSGKPGGKPAGKPSGRPAGKPAGKPSGKPAGKPAGNRSDRRPARTNTSRAAA